MHVGAQGQPPRQARRAGSQAGGGQVGGEDGDGSSGVHIGLHAQRLRKLKSRALRATQEHGLRHVSHAQRPYTQRAADPFAQHGAGGGQANEDGEQSVHTSELVFALGAAARSATLRRPTQNTMALQSLGLQLTFDQPTAFTSILNMTPGRPV